MGHRNSFALKGNHELFGTQQTHRHKKKTYQSRNFVLVADVYACVQPRLLCLLILVGGCFELDFG